MTSVSPPSDPQVHGHFFDGRGSQPRPAFLTLKDGQLRLQVDGEESPLTAAEVRISPRLGNAPRYLYLPDKAVFETGDNDGVDQLDRTLKGSIGHRLLHRLESNLGWIAIAAAITIAIGAWVFVYGIPWTARLIADALPESAHHYVGKQSLEVLDEHWLEPSALPLARRDQLRARFREYLEREHAPQVQVVFRSSEAIGANAFALADGTIVFTDDMVRLARDDRELLAVLGHEMGHVAYHHNMRGMVQSQMAFWVMVAVTGDLSSASESTTSIPAALFSLGYSRDMEREADQYALAFMQREQLAPVHFANIMSRLRASDKGSADTPPQERAEQEEDDQLGDVLGGFLSSHPHTRERIRRFQQAD
ncbi:M48 family metallopeptidase [Marinobacteraceae bacterium S3BR75-40.1]